MKDGKTWDDGRKESKANDETMVEKNQKLMNFWGHTCATLFSWKSKGKGIIFSTIWCSIVFMRKNDKEVTNFLRCSREEVSLIIVRGVLIPQAISHIVCTRTDFIWKFMSLSIYIYIIEIFKWEPSTRPLAHQISSHPLAHTTFLSIVTNPKFWHSYNQ